MHEKTYASMKEAFEDCENYKFALVYMMSRLLLCKTDDLKNIEFDEVTEARFFDENGEKHIFVNESYEICSGYIDDTAFEGKYSEVDKVLLSKDFQGEKVFEKLEVKIYYDYDDDGQIYKVLTRCFSAE